MEKRAQLPKKFCYSHNRVPWNQGVKVTFFLNRPVHTIS